MKLPIFMCFNIYLNGSFIHQYNMLCYAMLSHFSRVRLCATPQMAAHQVPPSLGFSRQEHWSGLPFPSPGDLPDPGIEPRSPALQADALPSEPPGKSIPCRRPIKQCLSFCDCLSSLCVMSSRFIRWDIFSPRDFSQERPLFLLW